MSIRHLCESARETSSEVLRVFLVPLVCKIDNQLLHCEVCQQADRENRTQRPANHFQFARVSSGNLLLWQMISAGTVPRFLTKKSAGWELCELRVLRKVNRLATSHATCRPSDSAVSAPRMVRPRGDCSSQARAACRSAPCHGARS